MRKEPSLLISSLPLLVMILLLGIGYGIFRIRIEALLIGSALFAGLLARAHGNSWKEMEKGIIESIRQAMPAILIILCVGSLIGTWIAAGTIPMLIYYGLKLISPNYFLVTANVVCSAVSLYTGTSWGTAGTVGVAFIAIAGGLGIPPGMAAGAIVSGAYFGDKLSPFSDTTNLAAITARSNLFDHIRHMLWTTGPAWALGLILYFILGKGYSGSSIPQEQMELMLTTLRTGFQFHILLLTPLIVMLYCTVRRLPTLPGMITSSLLAAILAVIFQHESLNTVVNAAIVGFRSGTGSEEIDMLLSRGGMMSMMEVILVALCAFAFVGIIRKAGMLDVILSRLLLVVHSTATLIASTVGSTVVTAFITGNAFLSIIIPGELFAPAFKKRELAAKNLSRTTEDSGTVIVPLIPWSMAGIYMAGTLGVPTLQYAKWAFMCYLGIVFALLYAFTGFAVAPRIRDDETLPGS